LIGTTGRRIGRPVLLYDTGCRLCRFAARIVARLDRRRSFALLGLDDVAAGPLLEHISEEERGSSIRLVLPDGRAVSAGAAALGVLERLPVTRMVARSFARLRALPAAEATYAFVARHRSRIGRLVPDGPAPRRYP
jgi:predicted DCC family thiol-disulfide oxidoreductase YuxK